MQLANPKVFPSRILFTNFRIQIPDLLFLILKHVVDYFLTVFGKLYTFCWNIVDNLLLSTNFKQFVDKLSLFRCFS